jgi:glycosyltransferase involved in cell wall biosynthesis
LGWSASEVVAICVARLSREKGLLDLVEAFADIAPHRSALRLLLVGDGPDANLIRNRLQKWITSRHAVIHPATPNVTPLLGASDIFVLPSLHENQSFAILEAMSSGLPVISTRVGGTPELVTHGETGLLIPPLQPLLLAEAMGQLAGDPALRKRFGLAGRQSLETCHSFERFIEQVGSVYHRMLGSQLANGNQ